MATIMKSMSREPFLGKNLLFTWSDIYPDCDISHDAFKGNCVFTYGNECRYTMQPTGHIYQGGNGNVIGIYYFKDFQTAEYTDGEDIIEVIMRDQRENHTWGQFELRKLIDVGDTEKYTSEIPQLLGKCSPS